MLHRSTVFIRHLKVYTSFSFPLLSNFISFKNSLKKNKMIQLCVIIILDKLMLFLLLEHALTLASSTGEFFKYFFFCKQKPIASYIFMQIFKWFPPGIFFLLIFQIKNLVITPLYFFLWFSTHFLYKSVWIKRVT